MAIECFEDIKAWQRARELTREVYAVSAKGNFNGFINYLRRGPHSSGS
jgi:hypothetical protein